MFLKRLKVFGFKSFADKTNFEFEQGIGGIIGPNGCGKSNVIDAFRWVLGETSMSVLRCKKYEDVIFGGTEKRKMLGYAEAEMTLDNSQRIFKDYDIDEISVKRKVFRDGDSQYFINAARCNLKEVHNLFLDTGVGKSAYSIIGQGQIEAIISTKPEKRREIFEEAAGISKYKNKIRDAERKLEKTEDNLLRINDIIFEVERNLENLKVQAEKAKEYKSIRNLLRDAEIQLALYKLKGIIFQREKIEDKNNWLTKRKGEIREKIDECYKDMELKLKLIQNKEEEQKEIQSKSNNLDVEIRTAENKIVMLREQHNSYEKSIFSNEAKAKSLKQRLSEIDNYLKLRQDEADNIEYRIEDYNAKLDELNEELRQINLTLDAHGKELNRLKNLNEEHRNDVNLKRKEQRQAVDELVSVIDEKKSEIAKQGHLKEDIKNEIVSYLKRIESGLKEKREALDNFIKSGEYKSPSSEGDLKEKLYDVLFEMEAGISYAQKAFTGFESYSSMEDVLAGLIFDKKGIYTKKTGIDEEINRLEVSIRDNINKIHSIEEDIDKKRETRERIYKMTGDIQVSIASLTEKKKAYSEEAKRTAGQKDEFEEELKVVEEEISKTEMRLEAIENEVHNTIDKYERDKALHKGYENSMHSISEQVMDLTRSVQKTEESQRELLSEERDVNKRLEELHLRSQELDIKHKNIVDNFYENFSVNLEEQEFREGEFNSEEVEKTKASLKRKLSAIGDNVNLLAIEEYEEMKERYDFLINQKRDLEESKKDLVTLIKEINDISKTMFIETLDKIKVHFTKVFQRLFNGGKANIVLTEPSNVLESGIEIEVQPPKKKLQNLSLLSGGEKTMTATALMFSILTERPSPFVLLDEIDAALDDINIGRFIKLVREFTEKTQFLIITHNPLTIQTCNFLYGITMEEPGITKVYSMKPDNKEKAVS